MPDSVFAAACILNIFVPLRFDGYSVSTVSDLSAIDAPNRPLWVSLAVVYILLVAAFGWGVSKLAYGKRRLSIVCHVHIHLWDHQCLLAAHASSWERTNIDRYLTYNLGDDNSSPDDVHYGVSVPPHWDDHFVFILSAPSLSSSPLEY